MIKKPVRLGDSPEFEKFFASAVGRALGFSDGSHAFQCAKCFDRGFLVKPAAVGGRRYEFLAHCPGVVVDGYSKPCRAAEMVVFRTRQAEVTSRSAFSKPAGSHVYKPGVKKQDQQQKSSGVRAITLRELLPSEAVIEEWAKKAGSLFGPEEQKFTAPSRELSTSTVMAVMDSMNDMLDSGADEKEQLELMMQLLRDSGEAP